MVTGEDAATGTSTAARLAALGPFFAADTHDAGGAQSASDAPWRPMAELLDDPDVPAARVEAVRGYLAAAGGLAPEAIPVRVAASVMHLGLVARTLSPLFALAVMGRRPGPVSLRDLWWQPTLGSMFALSIPEGPGSPDRGHRDEDGHRSGNGDDALIPPSALELCAMTAPFGLSPRILRGNLASALAGARTALATAEPSLAQRARDELGRWLAQPLLADMWRITVEGRFQRRSCCLIYQAAPDRRGPVCGDCVLLRPIEPDDTAAA